MAPRSKKKSKEKNRENANRVSESPKMNIQKSSKVAEKERNEFQHTKKITENSSSDKGLIVKTKSKTKSQLKRQLYHKIRRKNRGRKKEAEKQPGTVKEVTREIREELSCLINVIPCVEPKQSTSATNPYFKKRYRLFSKFDKGIKLDEESWYSVTPEKTAKEIAKRCKCGVIIDAFCGAGGNTIQFALTCNKVIAIDIDEKKIELARNNATVYGVEDKIDFIHGNFMHLAHGLKGDIVFLSPPWGGPSYKNHKVYDLENMLQPVPISVLQRTVSMITQNYAIFLPRNSNFKSALGPDDCYEIQRNIVNKKLVGITVYFNNLAKKNR